VPSYVGTESSSTARPVADCLFKSVCVGTDSQSASSSRLRSQSAHNASIGGRYDCSMGEASFDEEADSEVHRSVC
jgi:hypothetical protein